MSKTPASAMVRIFSAVAFVFAALLATASWAQSTLWMTTPIVKPFVNGTPANDGTASNGGQASVTPAASVAAALLASRDLSSGSTRAGF